MNATLVTQGKASFDGSFWFDAPVKIIFDEDGFTKESYYQNILNTGKRVWWESQWIKVPMSEKEAFSKAT